jgi:hypothetical protein
VLNNPFASPSAARTLCPWASIDHNNYYADIDNSEKCYTDFQDAIEYLNPSEDAYAVLVYGKAGCGKSALINRSAWWIQTHFESQYRHIVIVNLAGEASQTGVPVDEKLRTQAQMISEKLSATGSIAAPELKALRAKVGELPLFASLLEEVLLKDDILIVLLLPQLELRSELDAYQNSWRRRNAVCFYETTFDEVAGHSAGRYGLASARPILRLDVGSMRPEDGWAFVEVRLRVARTRIGTTEIPAVTRDVIERYMAIRSSGSETSIREFHITCYAVFENARKDNRLAIELDDFGRHWIQAGRYN